VRAPAYASSNIFFVFHEGLSVGSPNGRVGKGVISFGLAQYGGAAYTGPVKKIVQAFESELLLSLTDRQCLCVVDDIVERCRGPVVVKGWVIDLPTPARTVFHHSSATTTHPPALKTTKNGQNHNLGS
jgi:hypothetical protein